MITRKGFEQGLVGVKIFGKKNSFPFFPLLLKGFSQLLIEVTIWKRRVFLIMFLCGFQSTEVEAPKQQAFDQFLIQGVPSTAYRRRNL